MIAWGFGERVAGGFQLTRAGRAFDDAANVYRKTSEGMEFLRHAYLGIPAVQVLIQGLHGNGAVPADGAHYLVTRHGLFDPNDRDAFGSLLRTLNELRVIAYSQKHKTVRLTVPTPDEESDEPVLVRIVAPERPFSNRRHLRETLRECTGYIWWADPHFDKAGLEPLVDEVDGDSVKEIRILTGSIPTPSEVANHYKPFEMEMANVGVEVEVRVVAGPDRDWHDRYIVGKNVVWNAPPIKTVMKGSYSEFKKTDAKPPFDEWWLKGAPIS